MPVKKKTRVVKAKPAKTAPQQPTLTELLAEAGHGYTASIRGVTKFSTAYVAAISLYGSEGDKQFRTKYALYTDADWQTFEDIGKGRLLPQFAFASGSMKRGLLRLENSIEKQQKLCGFAGGKIEVVNSAGEVVKKTLDELTKSEEDFILFALGRGADPSDIRKFAKLYRVEFEKNLSHRPAIELVGDYLVIRRKTKLSKQEVEEWLSKM